MCATSTLDIYTCILYLASMKLLVHLTEAEWFEFDLMGLFFNLEQLLDSFDFKHPISTACFVSY